MGAKVLREDITRTRKRLRKTSSQKTECASSGDIFLNNQNQNNNINNKRSGDIAELREDGTFRLIDRKKDLVKLQLGEYVSLGKVEAQLKTNPVVDNICVYADSLKTHTVAIIVPVKEALERVAKGMKKSQDEFEEICKDNEVVQEVLKKLTVHGKTNGLEKFEIPTAITLCPEVWIPDSGLVTAAFKLKRKAIQLAFQPAIDLMYGK